MSIAYSFGKQTARGKYPHLNTLQNNPLKNQKNQREEPRMKKLNKPINPKQNLKTSSTLSPISTRVQETGNLLSTQPLRINDKKGISQSKSQGQFKGQFKSPDQQPNNGYMREELEYSQPKGSPQKHELTEYPHPTKAKLLGFKFSETSRERRVEEKPGPGEYEPNPHVAKDRIKEAYISPSKKKGHMDIKDDRMGPGNYDHQPKSNSPSFKIGERRQERNDNNNVGPGHYDNDHTKVRDSVRGHRFSPTKRDTSPIQKQVGPDVQYDSKHKSFGSDTKKVSIKGRHKEEKPKDIPGPEKYNPNLNMTKDRIKSAIISGHPTSRNEKGSKLKDTGISPGEYEVKSGFGQQNSRSFKITGKPKDLSNDNQIGPGHYDVDGSSIVKERSISYKISQTHRHTTPLNKSNKDSSPAPGQYERKDKTIGSDTKNIQFGGKGKQQKIDRNLGPGAYDANHNVVKSKVPTAFISKKRSGEGSFVDKNREQNSIQYELNHKTIGKDSQSFTMRGKPNDVIKDKSPGPGHYDSIHEQVKGKSISFKMNGQQRETSQNMNQSPGPGQYDTKHKTIGNDSNNMRIGGKHREQRIDNIPGPEHYSPNNSVTKGRIQSAFISKSSKKLSQNQNQHQIGPGEYNQENHKVIGSDCHSFTFRGKEKEQRQQNHPGPGAYNTKDDVIRDKSIGFKITDGHRDTSLNQHKSQDNLGPGAYEGEIKELERIAKMLQLVENKKKRILIIQLVQGHMIHEILQQKRKRDASGRDRENIASIGPGAYDYDHKKIGIDSHKVTIRGRPNDYEKDRGPGPGNYEPSESLIKAKSQAAIISPSKRDFEQSMRSSRGYDQMGPGAYDHQKEFGADAKSFQIKGKGKEQRQDNHPAPGHYDANNSVTKVRSQNAIISPQRRQLEDQFGSVGQMGSPGQYDHQKPFGSETKSFKIGEKRKEQESGHKVGPGSYDANLCQTKERLRGGKISDQRRETSPIKERDNIGGGLGPGHYNNNHKEFGKDCQNVTIRGKSREQQQDNHPAPGKYDVNETQIRVRSPNTIISPKKRNLQEQNSQQEQMGAPGQYDHHKPFGSDCQNVYIKGRPQDMNLNDSPGVGRYNPDESITKTRIQSAHINSVNRNKKGPFDNRNDSPDAGQYDVKGKQVGYDINGFKIGEKRKDLNQNQNPGPGYYDPSHSLTKEKLRDVIISKKQPSYQEEEPNQPPHREKQTDYYNQIGVYDRKSVVNKVLDEKNQKQKYSESSIFGKQEGYQSQDKKKGKKSSRYNQQDDEHLIKQQSKEYEEQLKQNSERYHREFEELQKQKLEQEQREYQMQLQQKREQEKRDYEEQQRLKKEQEKRDYEERMRQKYEQEQREYEQRQQEMLEQQHREYEMQQKERYQQEQEQFKQQLKEKHEKDHKEYENKLRQSQQDIRMQSPGEFQSPNYLNSQKKTKVNDKLLTPVQKNQQNNKKNGKHLQNQTEIYQQRIDNQKSLHQSRTSQELKKSANKKNTRYNNHTLNSIQKQDEGQHKFYDVQNSNKVQGFKMQGKPKEQRREDSPPVGHYNPNEQVVKDKIHCLVDYERSSPRKTDRSISPKKDHDLGPGTYNYSSQGGNQVFSFSKLERQDNLNNSPGPGVYNVPCKIGDVPEYSQGYKRNHEFKYVGK